MQIIVFISKSTNRKVLLQSCLVTSRGLSCLVNSRGFIRESPLIPPTSPIDTLDIFNLFTGYK